MRHAAWRAAELIQYGTPAYSYQIRPYQYDTAGVCSISYRSCHVLANLGFLPKLSPRHALASNAFASQAQALWHSKVAGMGIGDALLARFKQAAAAHVASLPTGSPVALAQVLDALSLLSLHAEGVPLLESLLAWRLVALRCVVGWA